MREAKGDILGTVDADGTYPIEYGKRVGRSKLSAGTGGVFHFAKFCLLIPRVFLRTRKERAASAPRRPEKLLHSTP